MTLLHLNKCLEDTETSPGLVDEKSWRLQWKFQTKHLETPNVRKMRKGTMIKEGKIPFVLQIMNLQVSLWFEGFQNLAADLLLGTISTYNLFFGISLLELEKATIHLNPAEWLGLCNLAKSLHDFIRHRPKKRVINMKVFNVQIV